MSDNSFWLFFQDMINFGAVQPATRLQILNDESAQGGAGNSFYLYFTDLMNYGYIRSVTAQQIIMIENVQGGAQNSFWLYFQDLINYGYVRSSTASAIIAAENQQGSGTIIYQDTFSSPLNPFWGLFASFGAVFPPIDPGVNVITPPNLVISGPAAGGFGNGIAHANTGIANTTEVEVFYDVSLLVPNAGVFAIFGLLTVVAQNPFDGIAVFMRNDGMTGAVVFSGGIPVSIAGSIPSPTNGIAKIEYNVSTQIFRYYINGALQFTASAPVPGLTNPYIVLGAQSQSIPSVLHAVFSNFIYSQTP